MYILKGNNGKNYIFEGPYNNISNIENCKGIYVILCNSMVVKTGISNDLRNYIKKINIKSNTKLCHGVPEYIVKYYDKSNKHSLVKIEREIRKYYNPPLNKLKTKTGKYIKKFVYSILLLLTILIILPVLFIFNCSETPVSVKKSREVNENKMADILDSVKHLYFKDSIAKTQYFYRAPTYTNTLSETTRKNLPDSNLIYFSLDSDFSKNIKQDNYKSELNILQTKPYKEINSFTEDIKSYLYMDIKIISGFYLQLKLRNGKTIKPQKPYFPIF